MLRTWTGNLINSRGIELGKETEGEKNNISPPDGGNIFGGLIVAVNRRGWPPESRTSSSKTQFLSLLSLSLPRPGTHSFRDDKSAKIDGGDTEKFNFLADSIIRGDGEPPRWRFQEVSNGACPIPREMIIEFLSRDPSVRGGTWRITRGGGSPESTSFHQVFNR